MSISSENNVFNEYVNSFLINDSNKDTIFSLPVNKKNFFLAADTCILKAENLIKKDDIEHNYNYINSKYPNDYAVTVKADGERVLLFINSNGYTYLVNNRIDFEDTGLRFDKDVGNTLMDGEFLKYKYLFIIRSLFFNNVDYRTRIFRLGSQDAFPESRYEKLTTLLEKLKIMKKYASNYKSSFNISLKTLFSSRRKEKYIKLSTEL